MNQTSATTAAPLGFWTVPNALTVGRLGLAAVACGLVGSGLYTAALGVFAVAAISDGLDGYLARRLNQATAIGRQLDPLVDKLMVAGLYVFLLPLPDTGLAPWMVAVIVARELVIQWLRSVIEGQGEAFGAKLAGKLKTAAQCGSIAAILAVLAFGGPAVVPGWLPWLRDGLTWAAVALTIYSGAGYVRAGLGKVA